MKDVIENGTCGEEDVLGGGVPLDEVDAALVVDEVGRRLGDGGGQVSVGDAPHFGDAVLAGRRDYVVVVGTPAQVQNGALVAGHQRLLRSHSAGLSGHSQKDSSSVKAKPIR